MSRRVSNKTINDVTLDLHISQISENLARCWVAANLLDYLQSRKENSKNVPVTLRVLEFSLTDQLVLTIARLWDTGTSNIDCLSFPNLKHRSDFTLSATEESELRRLSSDRFITTIRDARSSFVAHSISIPKNNSQSEIKGHEIRVFLESCHTLLSDLNERINGSRIGWGSFDKEYIIWNDFIGELRDSG